MTTTQRSDELIPLHFNSKIYSYNSVSIAYVFDSLQCVRAIDDQIITSIDAALKNLYRLSAAGLASAEEKLATK